MSIHETVITLLATRLLGTVAVVVAGTGSSGSSSGSRSGSSGGCGTLAEDKP